MDMKNKSFPTLTKRSLWYVWD